MMNSLERLQAFEEFLNACDSTKYGEKQWVGCGNPLAPILIVGKEPARDADTDEKIQEEIQKDITRARRCFENGDLTRLFIQEYNSVRGSTWRKYQALFDYILYGEIIQRLPKQNLPFGAWTFITEMNNTVSLKSDKAKKNLIRRKQLFADCNFFRDFSVVILACGKDYINNDVNHLEINNIFKVTFDMDGKERIGAHEEFGKGKEFYVHHSDDDKRLVIHTSHLGCFRSEEPLKEMAAIIRQHLKEQGKFPNLFWEEAD